MEITKSLIQVRDNSKNCCCYFAKKKQFFKRTSTEQNVTQKLKRQKLAQKKLTKNVELNKLVTDQRRFESRARLEQDSKHSAPFETEDEAKFQTNYQCCALTALI